MKGGKVGMSEELKLIEGILVHAEDEKTNRSWASDDVGWENMDAIWHKAEQLKKLLKEQEAKQVIRKQCKKEHDDGSIDYFAEWYCPHCNMLILRGFDNPSIKFCYKCGKPILWECR